MTISERQKKYIRMAKRFALRDRAVTPHGICAECNKECMAEDPFLNFEELRLFEPAEVGPDGFWLAPCRYTGRGRRGNGVFDVRQTILLFAAEMVRQKRQEFDGRDSTRQKSIA